MRNALTWLGPVLARVLLAAVFLEAGLSKLTAPGRAASSLAGRGFPLATGGAYASGLFELTAAVLFILGLKARAAALATVLYVVVVTWLFHLYPALDGNRGQMVHALKNASLCGGLLLLALHGPGRASLDGQ